MVGCRPVQDAAIVPRHAVVLAQVGFPGLVHEHFDETLRHLRVLEDSPGAGAVPQPDPPDFLQNEVTITDPEYLAGPWKFTYLYRRVPGYKIQEYVCEDNHAYIDAQGQTHVDIGRGTQVK